MVAGLSVKQFLHIFTRSSFNQIRAVMAQFNKMSGRDLEETIKTSNDYEENQKSTMLILGTTNLYTHIFWFNQTFSFSVKCCSDPSSYFTSVLRKVVTEQLEVSHLIRVFITRAEVRFNRKCLCIKLGKQISGGEVTESELQKINKNF